MKNAKRALVLMLSVFMMLSTMPFSVFAEDGAEAATDPAPVTVQEEQTEEPAAEEPKAEEPEEPAEEVSEPAENSEPAPAEEAQEAEDSAGAEESAEEAQPADAEEPVEAEAAAEEEYPAQTLKVTASDGAVITVKAQEGVFPADSYVEAVPVDEEDIIDLIDGAEKAAAYDITIHNKDGEEIQPNGDVQVSMKNTGLEEADAVYYANDAMTKATLVTDDIDSPSDSFTTDHFTIYTVVFYYDDRSAGAMNKQIGYNNEEVVIHIGDTINLTCYNLDSSNPNGPSESEVNAWNEGWHIYYNNARLSGDNEYVPFTTGYYKENSNGRYKPYIVLTAQKAGTYSVQQWEHTIAGTTGSGPACMITLVVKDQYTVTFDANGHGTAPASQIVDDGDKVTKPDDPEASGYMFRGWYENSDCTGDAFDFDNTPITGNKTLYAKWLRSYTVSFYKEENGELISSKEYAEGTLASDIEKPEDPTKASDDDYSYTFAGWSPELTTVTADATYYGTYTSNKLYTVHFETVIKDHDGGPTPDDIRCNAGYTVTVPNGPGYSTQTLNYFIEWNTKADGTGTAYKKDETFVMPAGDVTLYAMWHHHVTFSATGGSGAPNPIYVDGPKTVTIPDTKPTRDGYTFAYWKPRNSTDTSTYNPGDSFIPSYKETNLEAQWVPMTYKIEYDLDGGQFYEGYTIRTEYTPESDTYFLVQPYKIGYEFAGWESEEFEGKKTSYAIPKGSVGDKKFTATWDKVDDYTVTFVDWDGTVISTAKYPYLTLKEDVVKPADPTREQTVSHTYTFKKWENSAPDARVYQDITYTAIYEENPRYYKITFLNYDGSSLGSIDVSYGTNSYQLSATHLDNAYMRGDVTRPTRAATDEFTYTFVNWTPQLQKVTGDATYTAQYKEVPVGETDKYWVKFVYKSDYGYEITIKPEKYYAANTPASEVEVPPDPVREGNNQYEYIFTGWDKEVTAVTENTTYTALFDKVTKQYTITFVDDDGNVIREKKYDYDTSAEDVAADAPDGPTKAATDDTYYVFDKWDPDFMLVRGDQTYKPTYNELTKYTYTVADIHAGNSAESYPDITEVSDKKSASTVMWLPTADEAEAAQAYWAGDHTGSYNVCKGKFKAGETYYGIAIVKFDEGDTADVNRAVLKETGNIKAYGTPVVSSNNEVIFMFTATIPAITVTVEFGDGHAACAEAAAEKFEDVEATVSGTTLTYKAEKGTDMWFDVSEPIRYAITQVDQTDNGEQLGNPQINASPISEYSDAEAWYDDYDKKISDGGAQNSDVTLYVQWLKPTGGKLKVTPLVCGTEITIKEETRTETDPYTGTEYTYTVKVPSVTPEATVISGNIMLVDEEGNYWTKDTQTGEPFTGTVKGGDDYTAVVQVYAEFGYFINRDEIAAEGGEIIESSSVNPYAPILVSVEAEHDWEDDVITKEPTCTEPGEKSVKCKHNGKDWHGDDAVESNVEIPALGHDWGDWKVTKAPTATEEGIETRVCKHDSSHVETRAIPKIATYTITYDLNGGKLNGKSGKVTVTVEAGTVITLPEPKRDGYEFDYWKGSKYQAGDKYTVSENHTFTAQWVAEADEESSGPATGDANDIAALMLLMLVSAGGLCALGTRRRRDS